MAVQELTTALSEAKLFLDTLRNSLASAPLDCEAEGSGRSAEAWLEWGRSTKKECLVHVDGLKHLLRKAKALA